MITASIVLYNTLSYQVDTVLQFALGFGCIERLYIIDNSPNDWWWCFEERSLVIRYVHNENLRYDASHSLAIRKAVETGSRYHAVLNPDPQFGTDVICALRDFMDGHEDVGHVMPKILN